MEKQSSPNSSRLSVIVEDPQEGMEGPIWVRGASLLSYRMVMFTKSATALLFVVAVKVITSLSATPATARRVTNLKCSILNHLKLITTVNSTRKSLREGRTLSNCHSVPCPVLDRGLIRNPGRG